MSITGDLDPISIYIHIPFCLTKCPYCPFYSISYSSSLKNAFLKALKKEWLHNLPLIKNKKIVSVYFGGGTPSTMASQDLDHILGVIQPTKNAEITLEINPDDISKHKSLEIKSMGINRVSIGVQSLQDNELQLLKRRHSSKKALKAIDALHKSGIDNISIDLMYGIPNQTIQSWTNTLQKALKLPLDHLSIYDLSLEPNTPFYRKKQTLKLPNEQKLLYMHHYLLKSLKNEGFTRYEIASFAKNGKISMHNFGYWTGRQYLGLGPGASSYIEGIRRQNIADLNQYVQTTPLSSSYVEEKLPYPQNIKERIAIGLRIIKGIDLLNISIPPETKIVLKSLQKEKLLKVKNDQWSLTGKGLLFYDEVAQRII